MKLYHFVTLPLVTCLGCASSLPAEDRIVPATEFSRAVQRGEDRQFTIFDAVDRRDAGLNDSHFNQSGLASRPLQVPAALHEPQGLVQPAVISPAKSLDSRAALNGTPHTFTGDPRYTTQGYHLTSSFQDSPAELNGQAAPSELPPPPTSMLPPPPGSSAPYLSGQMTANPSLWPDEAQGASLFRDHRAFQAMDVITILVSESSEGKKKADTKSESKFSLTAALSNFFGLEVNKLGNPDVDPTALVNAQTDSKLDAKGETKRTGELKARMSAIILEVLPNGLLRIEGTKIISVNKEEEIMVLSGLVRPRDIDSANRIESERIANMRIDFYGRGVLADKQSPGWGARLFDWIWPF